MPRAARSACRPRRVRELTLCSPRFAAPAACVPASRDESTMTQRPLRLVALGTFAATLATCGSQPRMSGDVPTVAQAVSQGWIEKPAEVELTESEQEVLAEVLKPKEPTDDYRIRRSDELKIKVIGNEELSGSYRIGPDGSIGVPWSSKLTLEGLTRAEASEALRAIYQPHFKSEVAVAVDVSTYAPMKVYVLGAVNTSKEIDLQVGGTLLEALSVAGGLKREKEEPTPSRCAISRSGQQVIWVDLDDMLNRGNMALNIDLQEGDVVFVPDAGTQLAHVLGEVEAAGAIELGNGISLVESISKAGGPTEDADLRMVFLVRRKLPGQYNGPMRADMKRMLETGDRAEDVPLEDGDIVFVARNDIADVGYVLQNMQVLVSAATLYGLFTNTNNR